eukprot:CAMPEP_0177201714 /NCGR_PEP_ID=MMETSP0367-20130122/26899_1 /TAXON_ID=447022 ORGANISM="Scrippsiella hangoei-like, Strain SHHI-4" /NCGR_SAMPLE_ID=MMETSP0367 /ASSEMBLY_ACC=CAM_ASM_000362 /LENGTH=136 /DNA_ID=CAMNT_0018650237 /DNA_START=268 /DNA_END=678 /DNA_ORIENTATION=+
MVDARDDLHAVFSLDQIANLLQNLLPDVLSGVLPEERRNILPGDGTLDRVTGTRHLGREDPPDPTVALPTVLLQFPQNFGQLGFLLTYQILRLTFVAAEPSGRAPASASERGAALHGRRGTRQHESKSRPVTRPND